MAYFNAASLFGTTPEELQRKLFEESQAKRQKEIEFIAKQTSSPVTTYYGLQSLEPLSRLYETQGEDPRVAQLRSKVGAAQQAFQGFNMETPEGMMQAASRLMSMGMIEPATKLLNLAKVAKEARAVDSPFKSAGGGIIFNQETGEVVYEPKSKTADKLTFKKIQNPDNPAQEVLAGLNEAGEIKVKYPTAGGKDTDPAEVKAMKFFAKNKYGVDLDDPNVPMERKAEIMGDYATQGQQSAGAEKFVEKFGQKRAEEFSGLIDAAQAAPENIIKIDQTLDILNSGEAYTGFAAEMETQFARVGGKYFGDAEAQNKVSRTQLLEALLGSDVFPQISALGIGARGLDTPAERDFLMKVMTGQKEMTRETLLEMAQIRRNIQQRIIEKYNKKIANAKGPMKTIVDQYGYQPIEVKDYIAPELPVASLKPTAEKTLNPQQLELAKKILEIVNKDETQVARAMERWSETFPDVPFPLTQNGAR